jgi:hypothetical protein
MNSNLHGATNLARQSGLDVPSTHLYFPLARQIFAEDHLEPGELPRYYKNPRSICLTTSKRGGVPTMVCDDETDEMLVPTFEYGCQPSDSKSNPHAWTEEGAKRRNHRGIASMRDMEDSEALILLACGCPQTQRFGTEILSLEVISDAMASIEDHQIDVAYLLCSPLVFRRLGLIEHKHLYIERVNESRNSVKRYGAINRGSWMGIPILVSPLVTKNVMYIVGDSEDLGVIVDRKEVDWVPNNKAGQDKAGYEVLGEFGLAVLDVNAIAIVTFTGIIKQNALGLAPPMPPRFSPHRVQKGQFTLADEASASLERVLMKESPGNTTHTIELSPSAPPGMTICTSGTSPVTTTGNSAVSVTVSSPAPVLSEISFSVPTTEVKKPKSKRRAS